MSLNYIGVAYEWKQLSVAPNLESKLGASSLPYFWAQPKLPLGFFPLPVFFPYHPLFSFSFLSLLPFFMLCPLAW